MVAHQTAHAARPLHGGFKVAVPVGGKPVDIVVAQDAVVAPGQTAHAAVALDLGARHQALFHPAGIPPHQTSDIGMAGYPAERRLAGQNVPGVATDQTAHALIGPGRHDIDVADGTVLDFAHVVADQPSYRGAAMLV